MSQSDAYFQFPISLLKGATSTSTLCQSIIRYAVVAYGEHLALCTPPDVLVDIATRYAETNPTVIVDFRKVEQVHFAAAAARLGVLPGCVAQSAETGYDLYRAHGTKGTQCRMRCDYLWTAIRDDWLLMRFRVLCAVLAGVGDRDAAHVSTLRIRTLGAGHNSPKDATKKQPILSPGAVNHWIEKLWFQGLYQFCKYGKYRWYSIRQPSDEFLARVVKQKLDRGHRKKIIDASI